MKTFLAGRWIRPAVCAGFPLAVVIACYVDTGNIAASLFIAGLWFCGAEFGRWMKSREIDNSEDE